MNVDKICYFQYAKVSNYRNSSVSHVKKFKNILLLVLFFYWSPNVCIRMIFIQKNVIYVVLLVNLCN